MKRTVVRHRWIAGVAVLFAACSDAGPETVVEIIAPLSTEIVVGDVVQLTTAASGAAGVLSWSSESPNIATVTAGLVEALRPGPVVVRVSASGAVGDEIALTVVPRPGGYEAAEVDYFAEIALGAEFGSATPLLRRWRTDPGPSIRINGSPTPADLETVDSVVAEMNRLTPLDIQIVDDAPAVELHFVPEAQFRDILPEAPPDNVGLVWVWWGGDQYLFQSVVLIATDITEGQRAHIIREELTQMLGLLKDSFLYPESIFYQGSSSVTEYLAIDRAVIELLYRPELTVGMTEREATRVARRLVRGGVAAPGVEGLGLPRPSRLKGIEAGAGRSSASPGSAGSGARPPPLNSSRCPLRQGPSEGCR